MLIKKLKLNYFGRFRDREIELTPGINLIYGKNEAGKSTVHSFIKGILFGIERQRGRASKENLYQKYLPWEYPGAFHGSMDVQLEGKEYRLIRNFHGNDKSFQVIDLATGREVKLPFGVISDLIPGLTEGTFKNTISIEQLKAQTDSELAGELQDYITNLSGAKSIDINVTQALKHLNNQKKALESSLNQEMIQALEIEIEEGFVKEATIEALTRKEQDLRKEEEVLKSHKKALLKIMAGEEAKRIEQYPAILEKYKLYKNILSQVQQLEKQDQYLKEKISLDEKESAKVYSMKEDIARINSLREQCEGYEEAFKNISVNDDEGMRNGKKSSYMVGILPLIGIFIAFYTGFTPPGLLIAFALVSLWLVMIIFKRGKNRTTLITDNTDKKTYEQYISDSDNIIKQIYESYGVKNGSQLAQRYELILESYYSLENKKKQVRDINQQINEAEDQRDSLYDSIMKYMHLFREEDTLEDESMDRLYKEIKHRKLSFIREQEELDKKHEACVLAMEKLRWELSTLEGNEERLLNNKEKLKDLTEQQKDIAKEVEAISLAIQTIQELSIDIHDSFGGQLNQMVSNIVSRITEQRYHEVKMDEKLNIKIGHRDTYILLDKVSAGTMDQVYFSLRLAIADFLLGNNTMPLLLDDSFVFYDEDRVKNALTELSKRKQVLLFSCHQREKELLEKLDIPFHYIELN